MSVGETTSLAAPLGSGAVGVWLYHRFSVSFRDVDDLLADRGVIVSDSPCKTGPPYRSYQSRTNGPSTGGIDADGHTRHPKVMSMCPRPSSCKSWTRVDTQMWYLDRGTDILTACSAL